MVSAGIKNKTKLKEMDVKKLKLAIEQAQKVCNEMNKCANKFILQDSINDMNQALTIPVVVQPKANSSIIKPVCICNKMTKKGVISWWCEACKTDWV